MSNQSDEPRLVETSENIFNEINRHFVGDSVRFCVFRDNIRRLEANISKYSLAASMAAAKPAPKKHFLPTNDGVQWHKSVELTEYIYLCHRPMVAEAEFAILEYFPDKHFAEIHRRGWKAVEVLGAFIQDQRRALQVLTENLSTQVNEFLAEKYPGQDLRRVADNFVSRFIQPLPHQYEQSKTQNHLRGPLMGSQGMA